MIDMKKKSIEVFEFFLTSIIKYFKWFVTAAFIIILLTGVYKVDSNEVALVLRFGALSGSTAEQQIKQPGLHFALPSFLDEVVKVPVKTVQEMTVTTLYGTGNTLGGQVRNKGYVLTGDSNIVRIRIAAKYVISDPIAYALRESDAKSALSGIITNEMTSIITSTSVDDVLTTEKSVIASKTMRGAQEIADSIKLGVNITNIELTDITPPAEAIEAFNNATTASVQKQTLIQQANDYREAKIPEAQATAKSLVDAAKANQSSSVAQAQTVAEEFNGLYKQYEANPDVIKNGVFRTRVAQLLRQSGVSIVVPDNKDGSTRVILP